MAERARTPTCGVPGVDAVHSQAVDEVVEDRGHRLDGIPLALIGLGEAGADLGDPEC